MEGGIYYTNRQLLPTIAYYYIYMLALAYIYTNSKKIRRIITMFLYYIIYFVQFCIGALKIHCIYARFVRCEGLN